MILATLLGCGGPSAAPPTSPPATEVAAMITDAWSKTPAEVGFAWQMARAADALTITYTVDNHGADTLWLAQRMVQTGQGPARLLDRPVVRTNGRADAALIVLGQISPDVPVYYVPPPSYQAVAPGASVQGTLSVPLPLQSWHPVGRVDPLGAVQSVVFALDGFYGEPAAWKPLQLADGQTAQVPAYKTRLWIWSDAKPLPPG